MDAPVNEGMAGIVVCGGRFSESAAERTLPVMARAGWMHHRRAAAWLATVMLAGPALAPVDEPPVAVAPISSRDEDFGDGSEKSPQPAAAGDGAKCQSARVRL
jgi:hypothetical protein